MIADVPLVLVIGAYRQVLVDVITTFTIIEISASSPTVVTTAEDHGMHNGDLVVITGSNSIPSIDGINTVSVLGPRTFTVPVDVVASGTKADSSGTPMDLTGCQLVLIGKRGASTLFRKTQAGGDIAIASGLAATDRAVATFNVADTQNDTAGPGDWALWRTDIPTVDPLTSGPLTMLRVATP